MRDQTAPKRIIVGITGASGAIYSRRLIEYLLAGGAEVHLIVTPYGERLLHDELGIKRATDKTLLGRTDERLIQHPYRDVGSVLGSGSFHVDSMIVCPCSSSRLAAIAAGIGDNLLGRAAAVTIKEMRRLIIVYREMPMSRIDLQNALRLSECGAIVVPAAPGFYMMPQSIDDLVDFVVGKLLDLVGVKHALDTRWAPKKQELPIDK